MSMGVHFSIVSLLSLPLYTLVGLLLIQPVSPECHKDGETVQSLSSASLSSWETIRVTALVVDSKKKLVKKRHYSLSADGFEDMSGDTSSSDYVTWNLTPNGEPPLFRLSSSRTEGWGPMALFHMAGRLFSFLSAAQPPRMCPRTLMLEIRNQRGEKDGGKDYKLFVDITWDGKSRLQKPGQPTSSSPQQRIARVDFGRVELPERTYDVFVRQSSRELFDSGEWGLYAKSKTLNFGQAKYNYTRVDNRELAEKDEQKGLYMGFYVDMRKLEELRREMPNHELVLLYRPASRKRPTSILPIRMPTVFSTANEEEWGIKRMPSSLNVPISNVAIGMFPGWLETRVEDNDEEFLVIDKDSLLPLLGSEAGSRDNSGLPSSKRSESPNLSQPLLSNMNIDA